MIETKVQHGASPPRYRYGKHRSVVSGMGRGDWIVVPHGQAKGLSAAARDLGGRAMVYQVNEAQSCFKVLEAPWQRVVVHRLAG